jgi:hypothetical protein
MRNLAFVIAAALTILLLVSVRAAEKASYSVRAVATAGAAAPGGGKFAQFDPAANSGAILFDALVEKDAPFHALFVARGASLSRLVAVGDASPLGGTFIELSFASLNRRGHVAFLGSVLGGVAQAVYLARGESRFTKVIGVNDGAPGGGILQELGHVALNEADAVAFTARVEQGAVPKGIFLASKGSVEKVVGAGDPAEVGGRFNEFINVSINARGEVAFEGRVTGGHSSSGIFVASRSGLRKVAAVGDPTPVGGTFKDMALPLINDREEVLFWAALEGSPVPAGLFLASGGTITKVTARGDPLPGGGRLSFIGLSYSFNRSGVTAFEAAVVGAAATNGIFVADKAKVTPVVLAGDPTPLGGRFTDLSAPEIGPDGSVVFAAGVEGGQAASGLFVAVPTR